MKYGLFDNQLKTVEKILSSHSEIEEAVLFGSRAIDTFKEASDVDIALKGGKVTHKLVVELKSYFEEETNLPYFFDFTSYSHIKNKKLVEHIDKKGIVIYRKGWRTVKLKDRLTIYYGASLATRNRVDGNIPVYSSAGLTGWHNKALVKNRGIIVGRKGTIGSVYKSERSFFPIDTVFYISEKKLQDNLDFLFYALFNLDLDKLNSDSAVPGLNRNIFYAQEINMPSSLKEQKAIAEVLSSLDDKIELLHKQNKTLEDIAQTLFHKWFFQSINENKKSGKIGDISSLKSGHAFKSKDFIDSSIFKVVKIKNLKGRGVLDTNDTSCLNTEIVQLNKVKEYKLKKGDILLAMSGNTTGKIGVVYGENINLYLNQRVGKFFIKNPIYRNFLYLFLISGNYEEKFFKMGYGSAQPNISPTQVQSIDISIPFEKEVSLFDLSVEPLFEKIFHNQSQIIKLEKLRDTLLPKLITGQIRVKQNV